MDRCNLSCRRYDFLVSAITVCEDLLSYCVQDNYMRRNKYDEYLHTCRKTLNSICGMTPDDTGEKHINLKQVNTTHCILSHTCHSYKIYKIRMDTMQ